MKIVKVSAIPMSAPVPQEKRHRTDLGTKVKSDATLIRVETDNGLTGMGAALGTPPIVDTIVEHELAAECVGEDWEGFAPDSPLEGDGFEPSVPQR